MLRTHAFIVTFVTWLGVRGWRARSGGRRRLVRLAPNGAATRGAVRRRAAGAADQHFPLPRRIARPVDFTRSPGHVQRTGGSFGRRRGRGRSDQRGKVEIRLDPSGKGGAEVRKRGGMKFGVGCNPGALLEGKHRFRSHCREDYATVISMRFRALHFEVTVPGGEQAVGVGLNPREPSSSRGPSILEREHLESAVALDERT